MPLTSAYNNKNKMTNLIGEVLRPVAADQTELVPVQKGGPPSRPSPPRHRGWLLSLLLPGSPTLSAALPGRAAHNVEPGIPRVLLGGGCPAGVLRGGQRAEMGFLAFGGMEGELRKKKMMSDRTSVEG